MNVLQALRYFLLEALVGLARSWRVSLLAVLTISVSLSLAGVLLLLNRNLVRSISAWRAEARFVVYVDSDSTADEKSEIERSLATGPWVSKLDFVAPEESGRRFRDTFPSLSELIADARYGALPPSFEARLRTVPAVEQDLFRAWAERLATLPGVELVDDDSDWIADVEAILTVVRAVGSLLAGILLGAAVFTIAAVVRLTSLLYRDEIAIMRLVGATEFYIRGPFYVEGVLQGLFGSAAAVTALQLFHFALAPRLETSLVLAIVSREFLSAAEIGFLVLIGCGAGLTGALVSLGRERPRSESR